MPTARVFSTVSPTGVGNTVANTCWQQCAPCLSKAGGCPWRFRMSYIASYTRQREYNSIRLGGSKVGLNGCPFQRLREGFSKDTNRTRGRPYWNVSSCNRPTTTVIGPHHECKKVCPCIKALPISGIHAWIKQGQRKRDRGQEADGKKAAQQNKITSEERKQGLPRQSSG